MFTHFELYVNDPQGSNVNWGQDSN